MISYQKNNTLTELRCTTYYIQTEWDGAENTLHLSMPAKHPQALDLRERMRLYDGISGQVYALSKYDRGKSTIDVTAELDLDELCAGMLIGWSNCTTGTDGSAVYWGLADTISHVLPAGWTLDDRSGRTDIRQIDGFCGNPLELITHAVGQWDYLGVQYDNAARKVTLYSPGSMEPTGSYFTEDLNLLEGPQIKSKAERGDYYTRLYMTGKDGLQLPAPGYVENHTWDDRTISAYISDESIDDPIALQATAQKLVDTAAAVTKSYTCKVVDLAELHPDKYAALAVNIYDTVMLIDRDDYSRSYQQIARLRSWQYYPEKNEVTLSTVPGTLSATAKTVYSLSRTAAAAQVIAGATRTDLTQYKTETDEKLADAIVSIDIEFAQSSSTTAPAEGWSTNAPAWQNGKYMWQRSVTYYADGHSTTSDPVCITGATGADGADGADGAPGADGVGIAAIVNYYAVSNSGVAAPTAWDTAVQSMTTTNRYLWNYEVITYTDGTTSSTNKRVIGAYGDKGATGATGATGNGIASIKEYYLVSSAGTGVTTSTSGWSESVSATNPTNRYLWNYEVITYTNGQQYTSVPVIIGTHGETGATGAKGDKGDTGATGAAGIGISGVSNYYAVSSSSSTAPTSWSTTVPTMTATNKYLWNYEVITYTDGTTSSTTKRVIGAYGDKGATGATGATGNGIKNITEYYLASTASSGVTTSTSGWTTTMQTTTTSKKYLWNYEVVGYTDGTSLTTTPIIIGTHGATGATGATGPAGRGISSTAVTYQASSSGTTVPTGTWSTSIPSLSAGQYLWTRTVITYTDSTTSTSYSVGMKGATGATGPTGAAGADGKMLYATCSTAAATVAKVAALSSGTLILTAGATVSVKFAYANTAASPTLNVGGTGAKTIWVYGAALTASSPYNWRANSTVLFVYNGSQWVMADNSAMAIAASWTYQNNTTYIDGAKLYAGTVAAEQIAASSITADKIKDNEIFVPLWINASPDSAFPAQSVTIQGHQLSDFAHVIVGTNGCARSAMPQREKTWTLGLSHTLKIVNYSSLSGKYPAVITTFTMPEITSKTYTATSTKISSVVLSMRIRVINNRNAQVFDSDYITFGSTTLSWPDTTFADNTMYISVKATITFADDAVFDVISSEQSVKHSANYNERISEITISNESWTVKNDYVSSSYTALADAITTYNSKVCYVYYPISSTYNIVPVTRYGTLPIIYPETYTKVAQTSSAGNTISAADYLKISSLGAYKATYRQFCCDLENNKVVFGSVTRVGADDAANSSTSESSLLLDGSAESITALIGSTHCIPIGIWGVR